MRSKCVMVAERGMTVGAQEARLVLNSVGVQLERDKEVVERGGS